MFSKTIFALAMMCVVKASLVTAFDDDPEIEVASNLKRCDLRACEKLCRRLKFPGGACVKGRCKCDNFLNAEYDLETEVETSLNRCNVKACDWVCRRLNMTSGSCVEGQCKCEKSSRAEDAVTEPNVEDSVPIKACNNKKCNQLCRKQKFRGGSCIGANCYCNKFLSVQDDEVSEESLPVSKLSEDPTKRRCDSRVCHQFCRRLKLSGGVCVNGRCKCDHFFGTEEDAVDEYSELDTRRVCELSKCGRTCSRRGYEGATCVEGRCKCYNISKTSLPVSELSEDPTERGCNMQACDELCRRLKFPGGACVNGRCKCDNFFGEEEASPLNDATSDENEESNDVLTNEEELIASAPSACNTVSCNQMCHRLKYTGGWCRFGQCQCY